MTLKSCPFCGAVLELFNKEFTKETPHKIYKIFHEETCYYFIYVMRRGFDGGRWHYLVSADGVRGWNTRATGWQPIETAPKDFSCVILCGKDGYVACGSWSEFAQRWCTSFENEACYEAIDATHWQPLPEPPKEAR